MDDLIRNELNRSADAISRIVGSGQAATKAR